MAPPSQPPPGAPVRAMRVDPLLLFEFMKHVALGASVLSVFLWMGPGWERVFAFWFAAIGTCVAYLLKIHELSVGELLAVVVLAVAVQLALNLLWKILGW